MVDNALARMDAGEANRRIIAKLKDRADFRRVEGASIKRKAKLGSHEGKTALVRYFLSLEESMYVISAIARVKLPDAAVEEVERVIMSKMAEVDAELNGAFDECERLMKNNGIDEVATFDTVPLEVEVSVITFVGRRYFELIHKMDQLVPLLATLQIWEVLKPTDVAHRVARVKRIVYALARMARNLKMGMRRRMNEVDAKLRQEGAAAIETVPAVGDVSVDGRKDADSRLSLLHEAHVMAEAQAMDLVRQKLPPACSQAVAGNEAGMPEAELVRASMDKMAANEPV